ncbi:alpha/beta hydrolase family protein [uncultured Corynebacterium sp.]|uniref:alpha/beta hydrolase n=1 Tax=uncultured Corynebacterium sp. TaxID=159447 RepID=UPI0025E3607A|nr:alpha/beta hydrolase family protein [uncultured Corynebacterium sp.]
MSFTAIARGWKAKALAAMVAVATIFGMMQFAATEEAQADPHRGYLRAGCEWDNYNYWVQYCQVWSEAMGRNITVHVRPGTAAGSPGLYLLDGLRARDDWSEYVWRGHAPRTFEHDNVTLAMPVGGESSFYTDWNRPAINARGEIRNYKWETFLTQELPVYLDREFQTSRTNNAVAGLSMGGSAAMSLAYNHRNQFKQASAFSGYFQVSNPVVSTAIAAGQIDQGGYDPTAMWGPPGIPTPGHVRNDPSMNLDKMQGLPLFITSANGYPSHWSTPEALLGAPVEFPNLAAGMILEGLSRASTQAFEGQARAAGLNPTVHYSPDGIHSWELWERDLQMARPHIKTALGI